MERNLSNADVTNLSYANNVTKTITKTPPGPEAHGPDDWCYVSSYNLVFTALNSCMVQLDVFDYRTVVKVP